MKKLEKVNINDTVRESLDKIAKTLSEDIDTVYLLGVYDSSSKEPIPESMRILAELLRSKGLNNFLIYPSNMVDIDIKEVKIKRK